LFEENFAVLIGRKNYFIHIKKNFHQTSMGSSFLTRNKSIIISSSLVLSIMIIEIIFRDDFIAASLDVIVSMQTKLPSFSKYIFHAAAGLADPDIILGIYLLVLALQINKYFLVKLGLYIAFIGYFLSVTKTIYGNPRPYWLRPYIEGLPGYEAPGIRPFEKYAEYGNPSGHAFFSVAFYGYLFYIFTVDHRKKKEREHDQATREPLLDEEQNGEIVEDKNVNLPAEEAAGFTSRRTRPISHTMYRIVNVLFVVAVALVCTSRLYLGMHSLNQVMMGLTFGTFYMFVFIRFIDQKLENFLKTIAKQELENRPLVIWSFSLCYMLASFLPIAIYITQSESHSIVNSDMWARWWIVIKTELPKTSPNGFAHIRCLLDSGVIGGFFGILLGALASDGSYTETSPKVRTIPKMKIFFRVLVFFVVAAIPAGILRVIPCPEQNYILTYFVQWNMALFMAGFSATKFVPIAYSKLNLDIEGDFLRFVVRQQGRQLSR